MSACCLLIVCIRNWCLNRHGSSWLKSIFRRSETNSLLRIKRDKSLKIKSTTRWSKKIWMSVKRKRKEEINTFWNFWTRSMFWESKWRAVSSESFWNLFRRCILTSTLRSSVTNNFFSKKLPRSSIQSTRGMANVEADLKRVFLNVAAQIELKLIYNGFMESGLK
jgi:hypothetical protein